MFYDDYKQLGHRFKKRRWLANLKAFTFRLKNPELKVDVKPNTLLIVRVDRIGDYVLFRDFLRVIRQSERFKDYHITLCGNQVFRDIAETFDANVIDDFIWLDRSRFMKHKNEHYKFLHTIRSRGFETVLQPTYSRDIEGDLIVLATGAPHRIGVNGDNTNQSENRRRVTDTFYTELIQVDKKPQFEFNRNKEVVEKVLGHPVNFDKPIWPKSNQYNFVKEKYAVFITGAGDKRKRWDKFETIADFLFDEFGHHIVFVGKGKKDKDTIQNITKNARFQFSNFCDELSLIKVAGVLQHAKLVFGNDSGLVHMAAVQNVPTICVSPGTHAFRFNHYPASFHLNTTFLFPPELEQKKNSEAFKNYSSQYAESYDVRSISAERVKQVIRDVLSNE